MPLNAPSFASGRVECDHCGHRFWRERKARPGESYVQVVDRGTLMMGPCPCRVPVFVCTACLPPCGTALEDDRHMEYVSALADQWGAEGGLSLVTDGGFVVSQAVEGASGSRRESRVGPCASGDDGDSLPSAVAASWRGPLALCMETARANVLVTNECPSDDAGGAIDGLGLCREEAGSLVAPIACRSLNLSTVLEGEDAPLF